jgi:hypothetical protein
MDFRPIPILVLGLDWFQRKEVRFWITTTRSILFHCSGLLSPSAPFCPETGQFFEFQPAPFLWVRCG